MLKYFCGAPFKIYLHEYLTPEYFHTQKFPDLRYVYLLYISRGKFNYKHSHLISLYDKCFAHSNLSPVPGLKVGQVIWIIQVTFCPGQAGLIRIHFIKYPV